MDNNELIEKFLLFFYNGIIAAFGAMAKYLHENSIKGTSFRFLILFSNGVVGFVIGNIVGSFISEHEYKDGILWLSGFFYMYIIGLLETVLRHKIKEHIKDNKKQ